MEVLDVVQAWQIEVGDLVQFEAYDGDERYVELLMVEFTDEIENQNDMEQYILLRGESLRTGDTAEHELDPYLDVEVMGA